MQGNKLINIITLKREIKIKANNSVTPKNTFGYKLKKKLTRCRYFQNSRRELKRFR